MKRRKEREGIGDERRLRGIGGLTAAAILGAGIALLFAPSSGEEARHTIGRGYRKAKKTFSRRAEDLRDRAADLLERRHDLSERGFALLRGGRSSEAVRRRA